VNLQPKKGKKIRETAEESNFTESQQDENTLFPVLTYMKRENILFLVFLDLFIILTFFNILAANALHVFSIFLI
jgi:hypothetical protein